MSSAAESAFAEGQAQVSPTLAPDQSIPPTESAEKPHKKISAAEAAFAEGQGVAPEQEDVPFAEKLKTTPYEGLSKLQQDRLTTFTTPEEIAQIPKHIPKTDEQLRTQFEHERSLPWNEGMRTSEDWYNIGKEVIGTGVKFAKGVKKYAEQSLFSGAEEDPSGWGKPSIQPTKDLVSSAVQLPEDVAYFGTKLAEGGTDWTDRLSEKFGLHDKQKSFENYKARHMVDMAHAQTLQETPSVYGRVLKNEMANKALAAVILNTLPDTKTIMEQDGISEEQANAKRQSMADQIAQQTTSDSAAQEKAADEDIALTGSFMMPAGLGLGEMGAVGLAAETAMGLSPKIAQGLKYLGKTDAEIKAMNDAAQALQKQKLAEKIEKRKQPSMVGRTAGAIAEGVDKLQALREAAPEGLKNLLPVGVGAFAGYETDKEHPLMGALIGGAVGHGAAPLLKIGAYAAKAPALIRDIDEARALAAGGSKGTFETLGSIPDVSEQTAKILRFGGKNLDNIINNSVEYAKAGIHPTLVALATGALDSASPEERNQMLSTGLLYGLGGRALHHTLGKITGVDPVIEQRERQQQAVDDYKTYKDLDPETQKAMNGLTSWDNVIKRHEKMVSDAMVAYNDAVRSGSKDAEKLGKALNEERKTLSAVTRANVQTRNEFGRQFLTQLTRLNELTNGTLRAGQNNVGVHILTPDQIFEKFRKDPANNGMSDADIMDTANQQGFYSTPEGAVEYQAGMPMGGVKKTLIFDRTKPSIVINANHLKARQQIFGETPTEALTHEFGHHIRNIPEFREANRDAEDLLFAQDIKDLNGNVTATTSGRYSTKDLVDMYQNNYMKGKSPDQIEQLSKLAGLWDETRGALNEQAVADYMKDEIVAQLNAGTLSNHLGKDLDSGTLHLMDVATLKTKKNLLDKAVQKFFGLGGKGSAVDPLTGAEFSPEIIAANRQAMRALQALQGEVSPAVKAPDAPKISRALMIKNRAIMEKYGKYSGLFKTKMQGQIYDAEGNPVGAPVEITNPAAAEGSWATDRQLSGYGQKPDEVRGMNIPDGGRLVVSQSFVTEADGVTPAMYTPQEAKKLQKARKDTIIQALDTPDHGTPNRFQPVADNSETFRGTFTPLQIQAIKDLPEGIIPKSIKDHLLKINEAIVRGDGSRLLVDYAAVMNDAGKYTAYSPKIYDVVPIGMHLSKDGNFLVTTISVGRMFEKLNAWSQRMPARLSPWGGDKNAFFKEFTEKYLQNWQNGLAGETGLAGTPAEALAKKNIFNDFLNLTTKDFRDANDDRTRTPRQRGDVRGKDMDRTIMSMRLDHMAELMDNEYAPKVPVDYRKAIRNFMPDVAVVPERFFGTGQEPVTTNEEYKKTKFIPEGGRRSKYVTPPSVFSNYDIGQFEKGGKFFDRETGEDVTGKTYSGGAIDVSSGTPSFTTGEESDAIQGTGNKVLTNLFKQKAGWKWASENPPPTKTLVSVEGREGHYYSLRTELPNGVNLTRNPETGEPRLRPSSVGKINLGQEIGRINIRGREHPVYDKIVVGGQPAAPTGIRFMPASAEIREEGTKQHLEFFDRELENSGIKQKPATMAALDAFIHKYVGEKYALLQTNFRQPAEKQTLFPKIDPEKIKNYYQKVVRNATPAQAADFPPDWLRYRNMSQQEFDRSFEQDKVDQITQFRVNALAKSANYLLGEMKNVNANKEFEEYQKSLDLLKTQIDKNTDPEAEKDLAWNKRQLEIKLQDLDYEKRRGSYIPAEVAAILNTSAKFRVNAGYDENGEMVPLIQNISNGNEAVPNEVSGETASKIAGYMRNGMSSKDAYAKGVFDVIKARAAKRGVYTGWKKYDQSSDMGDAETLNADCAGTGWCTGGEVGTANSHLTGGDFYLYFDEGQPQVAIRTNDGEIVEVRGRGPSQNITKQEYDKKAEEFILGGEGPTGGSEYLHDRNFRKTAVGIMQTGVVPESAYKYYNQRGMFIVPKPKMSYANEFDEEYIQPFRQYAPSYKDVFDAKTGVLKTSYDYSFNDSDKDKYKVINGDIITGTLPPNPEARKFTLPNLQECGNIDAPLHDSVSLPNLKKSGYLNFKRVKGDIDLTSLEDAGDIMVNSSEGKIDLPKLVKSGDLLADSALILNAPNLKECNILNFSRSKDSYMKELNVPKLQKAKRILADHTLSIVLPELKKCENVFTINSGYLYAPKLENVESINGAITTIIPSLKDWKRIKIVDAAEVVAPAEALVAMDIQYEINPNVVRFVDSDTGKAYNFEARNHPKFNLVASGLQTPEIREETFQSNDPKNTKVTAAAVKTFDKQAQEISYKSGENHQEIKPLPFIGMKGFEYRKLNRIEREGGDYGFEIVYPDGRKEFVNRRDAFKIAKAEGQLKRPTTEEQKIDTMRGVLHSDMVNYAGAKGGVSFLPADADHASAVERGDMEEAQRLVDEAAKKAGYDITAYHGSPEKGVKVLSPKKAVEVEGAVFLSSNPDVADQYRYERAYGDIIGEDAGDIVDARIKLENPYIYKPKGKIVDAIEFGKAIDYAKKNGNDGVIVNDIDDSVGMTGDMGTTYAVFNPEQIKSADPATYDNEGKLIPLSQRFDTTKSDIRFMPSTELPKTDDGKVDWAGFNLKTTETAKPLAGVDPIGGISFKPAQEIELDKPDAVQKAGVATKLPKKVPESGHYTIAMQPTDDGREVQYQVDPASTITPKVGSIEDIDGEQVGILEADRHTTRGDNMGGPLHPFLISNQVIARLLDGRGFKPVWANMNSAFVTRAKNIITNTTNGRALIQIMKEQAHKSNRKFVQDIMQEIDATKKNLSADEKDALHVILELGAKNPAKHLARVTKAAKLLKDGEITQSEFEMIKSQNADKIEKYGPQVEFLKKLGTMKSMATKGNRAGFDKAFKDHNDQFKNEDWYKKIVNKYKNTTFQDEASRFTFVERGAAMSRLDGIAFAPPISQRLADVMDFRGGKNLDLVASVQLSKDPDAFAIYTGKDPKQEAKMSKNERILRDQFMKDPNFRKHPSYDWMMLGPENADNFILEKPVDPMSLFPDYAKNHPKESVRNGSKETIVGTMKKSKIPLIIKTKK